MGFLIKYIRYMVISFSLILALGIYLYITKTIETPTLQQISRSSFNFNALPAYDPGALPDKIGAAKRKAAVGKYLWIITFAAGIILGIYIGANEKIKNWTDKLKK